MEQLIKRLKELGYELVYDESSDSWRVIDFLTSMNDFLPSAFSKTVFEHGFVFSFGITISKDGLCVKFYEL